MFTELSGDINPLHLDSSFAQKHGYPDRVVYGMLTASFYSTLAGVYLPGENCLLYEVDTKFTRPVFLGDILTICGKVVEVDQERQFIRIKATIKNQKGEIVSRAKIMAGVLQDGA